MASRREEEYLARFRRAVAKLKDDDEPLAEKVELLHQLCVDAGFGDYRDQFVGAQGIDTLVQISTADWPEDGNLINSCSIYDKSARMSNPAQRMRLDSPKPNEPPLYQSMRRVAVGCLGEMCHYKQYVVAMHKAGLYTHMPQMLRDTGRVYQWGQSYSEMYGSTRGRHPNHAQFIFERLVYILGYTIEHLPSQPHLTDSCIPIVVKAVDNVLYEDKMMAPPDPNFSDPFPETFFRMLSKKLARPLTTEALFALIQAGVISKVRSIPTTLFTRMLQQPLMDQLQGQYEMVIEEVHLPRIFHHMNLMEQVSEGVKNVGNQLVAEGKHSQAAARYKEALGLNPWNHSAAANRSLCLLKLGKNKDALDCALLAVQLSPDWAKGWARVASAFVAVGEVPSAKTCVEIACKLQPNMEEEFCQILAGKPGKKVMDSSQWKQAVDRLDSCSQMVRVYPRAVRVKHNQGMMHWTLSFATLFDLLGSGTGEPTFILQLACAEPSDGMVGFEQCEGVPSPTLIINFVLRCIVHAAKEVPLSMLVAYRAAYAWPMLKSLAREFSISITLESKEDAMASASRHGNDYLGFNMGTAGKKNYRPLMLDL